MEETTWKVEVGRYVGTSTYEVATLGLNKEDSTR